VRVGGAGGLPGVSVVGRQQLLELTADARLGEQPARDLGRPVGQRDLAQSMPAQETHSDWHVRVNAEIGEASQDVINRVLGRPVEARSAQRSPQRAASEAAESASRSSTPAPDSTMTSSKRPKSTAKKAAS
jgi:cobalamin biosynthesis protein CobT